MSDKCPLCDITTGHSHFSYDIAEYVDALQSKLEQRIALEIDDHLKVVELQAKLDRFTDRLNWVIRNEKSYGRETYDFCKTTLAAINRIGREDERK